MNRQHFSPFIEQLLISTLLFLGIPITLLCTGIVQINFNNEYINAKILVIIIAVCVYMFYLFAHFVPGIAAIIDLITNNFITEKNTYVESFVVAQKFSARKKSKKQGQLADAYYLRVILANNDGKSSYATTFFHEMKKGESYTIVYGKYSKILLSALSEQGEEMLNKI